MHTLDEQIELLTSYRDGKQIQWVGITSYVRSEDLIWVDCDQTGNIGTLDFTKYMYRVKPQPREVWININRNGDLGFPHPTRTEARHWALMKSSTTCRFVQID